MATSNYFNAAYPEPWQILGVKLRPFSLGHYIKLRMLGCGFVSEETQTATLKDLVLGVVVCSMPSDPDPENDRFWTWLNRDRQSPGLFLRNLLRKIIRKPAITPAEWDMLKFGRKCGVFDFAEKARLFSEYISRHSRLPAYNEEPDRNRLGTSGAHWSQSVLSVLVSKCNYTQREALNIPLTRAWADVFKVAEENGTVRLLPLEVAKAMGEQQ